MLPQGERPQQFFCESGQPKPTGFSSCSAATRRCLKTCNCPRTAFVAGEKADENTTLCMVGAAQKAAQKNGVLNLGGRPRASLDLVLDGLFYRLRNAGPWRDQPECFGPWRTIYGWHRLWARDGLWKRMLTAISRKTRNRISWWTEHTWSFTSVPPIPQEAPTSRPWAKHAEAETPRSWHSPMGADLQSTCCSSRDRHMKDTMLFHCWETLPGCAWWETKVSTATNCASSFKCSEQLTAFLAGQDAESSARSAASSTGSVIALRTTSAVSSVGLAPALDATNSPLISSP